MKEKEIQTKKRNKTLNTSNIELDCYLILLNFFNASDICCLYKSSQYPYFCDFYIISLDLYIEINAHWTHGIEPFDITNIMHQKILKQWKKKSKTSNFYKNTIRIWTVYDVKKRNTAYANNLKYLEFKTIVQLKNWCNSIQKNNM